MEECPICNVPMSHGVTKMTYHSCCGKTFCNGCKHAIMVSMTKQGKRGYVPSEHAASLVKIAKKNSMCPFCRSETWTDDKEWLDNMTKRAQHYKYGDACMFLGFVYMNGFHGLAEDREKGMELLIQGGEYGSVEALLELGLIYSDSRVVPRNMRLAFSYFNLAASKGHNIARYNLAMLEYKYEMGIATVVEHLIIASGGGYADALSSLKKCLTMGWCQEKIARRLGAHTKTAWLR